MNKKQVLKTTGFILLFIILITVIIILLIRISFGNNKIEILTDKTNLISKKIRLEKKNQKKINETDKNFLKSAYFDRDGEYFEKSIRDIFNRYQTEIKIYQSTLDKKNEAEITIGFKINAFHFFKLINDLEKGEKLIVIKNVQIKRDRLPLFNVRMTLGAYYKE